MRTDAGWRAPFGSCANRGQLGALDDAVPYRLSLRVTVNPAVAGCLYEFGWRCDKDAARCG